MANVLIRDLPDATLAQLKRRAAQNRRSMQREIQAILHDALDVAERRHRMIETADALRVRIAAEFPQQSNSADLIREDRER